MSDEPKESSHKFIKFFLFVVLFAIDSIVFNGAGRLSALALTAFQAIGLLLSSLNGDWGALAQHGLVLLKSVLFIILNLVIYYIVATLLTVGFGIFMRRKKP